MAPRAFSVRRNGKTIPVRDRGSPCCCETSRLPHFLENRFTNGGEVEVKIETYFPAWNREPWPSLS
jgi:hypothetical protein